nr:gag pol polyprotein [Hymenolepis microstoma]
MDYLSPQSVKSLRRFLGVVNYYGRSIPNRAQVLQSLTDLLKGNPKHFKMASEAESAFSSVKQQLSKATTLNHLDTSKGMRIVLKTDASQMAVGAVLQQVFKDELQPLSFFSKKLTPTETQYSTFGRELLVIYLAVKHFQHILEGRQFTIFTDHKPLIYTMRGAADHHSPREIRHLDFISQFISDTRHIDGTSNVVADAMFCLELNQIVALSLDLQVFASEQRSDPYFAESLPTPSYISNAYHYRTLTLRSFAMFQPAGRDLLSLKRILGRFSTISMPARSTSIHEVHSLVPLSEARFRLIHVDIVGLLPPSNSFSYILTCIDRFTRWPIAVPLHNTSSAGSQFTSTLFRELNQLLGSTHVCTTAYHPEANGLVERFHRQLKSDIIATSSSLNRMERLPIILLSIRSTVKEDLGCCPAELILGTTIRLPGEMFAHSQDRILTDPSSYSTHLKEHFRSIHPAPTRSNDRPTHIHKDFSSCPFVFVRVETVKKHLQPPYDVPYKVFQRKLKHFILDRNGTKDSESIDRLKPT